MKQLGEFVVDGKVVEIPGDEREEFEQLAKEHAATPDELHSLRVTETDGRSVDVKIPESQREEFERMAEEKGATFEPLRTLELDDGTKKSMTGGEISRYLRGPEYRNARDDASVPQEQGSVTWAAIKGAIGGFFTGAWAGGNAAANKIAKAIPEIGIEVESAAGNLARFAGKGLKAVGAEGVGAAVEGAGESIVESAGGAKAWLDEKLPSDVKDWLGYEDWSTKVVDWTNNAAAMAVKFAPGMAKMGAEAFMETIFSSDGVNAAARAYDTAIANGQSPEEAAALGGEAFLLNYFGGKALTKAGAWAGGVHGPVKQFMASGMASSGTMATQAAGNKMIDNLAEGKPVLEGVAKESGKGFVEGWAFHGYNALPGLITGVAASRAEHRRREEYARGEILRMVETDVGAAKLAMWMDGEALDAAIRARKAEKAGLAEQSSAIRAEALRAGLPETMTPAEINKVLDAVAEQREALANRVRINMDDVQAEALSETVAKVLEAEQSSAARIVEIDQKELMERTWNRAADKVTDARDMDDPELREKIVRSAAKEVAAEMEKERRAELDEKSRIRGAEVGEQMKILDDRGIATWEDAEAAGLVGKDERGRWSGGARQAVNISVNGTEALKTAVKDGKIGGDLAEEMITLSHCELGWLPKESREAIIDKVLEAADGNAEMAQWMMEIVGRCDRAELADVDARVRKVADEVAQGLAEQSSAIRTTEAEVGPAPETAYEGAKYAERLKGTELKSIDGGMLGCERFPEVSVEISQEGIRVEGLTDELMSKPENTADTAALLKRLDDISRRTGLEIDLGDANALTVAQGIIEEVKRGSLKEAQRKMDTRAQLFDLLMKTTLGNGVTYDEASFNAALEKTPNGRRFVDNHGNIYGFKDGDGVLHFNPSVFNYNTPIHEYGHLALESLKGVNPALLKRGMELIKESDYYKEFKERSEKTGDEYEYLKGDEEGICDEALATLIGDRGQRLVDQKGLGAELKAWLKEFWAAIKGAFGIADLTPEQIEKMTLRDFADVMNAELLRGREFGTKKQRPLSEKSIKRYDEAEGSGSSGVLRWKNDRGRLFYIPVDVEKTQPGGKVVLATDDANVTDWIQQRLNGVELRMSKSGKIYVKARGATASHPESSQGGFEGELAEIFGRYPKAGQNDGVFEQLASDLQNEALREATPDQLVSALVDDRANYDAWLKVTADGKTLEALKEEQHYAEEAEREAAEARERFEQSGMGVLDYIRSRAAEEGEPGFDLDWETMRELARDAEEGKFAIGGIFTGSAADYEKPSLHAVGTGERSQVYGWGLYGSTVRGVAEGYAMSNGGKFGKTRWRKNGEEPKTQAEIIATDWLGPANGNPKKAIKLIKDRLETVKALGLDVKPYLEAIKDLRDHGDAYSISGTHIYEQTFFTDRAPGDESHLLKWYEDLPKEQVDWIAQEFAKEGFFVAAFSKLKGWTVLDKASGRKLSLWDKRESGETYEAIASFLGSPQAASEFLARAGIDGVKYPVDSYGGKGVKDGDEAGWNYVSFRDDNIRVDHKWTDGAAKFAAGRAVKPSALGDGKQRYYEVPFDKAVDKIVKNKKPIGNEQVFVSETPKVFADIGFARLPIMMTQNHVLTISSDAATLKSLKIGGNAHDMKAVLKQVPKAIQRPLMVIVSETRPDSSVVAITQLKDRNGKTVIVPIALDGISPIGNGGLIDSHIITSAYGKGNVWSKLVEDAIAKETNGEVGVFYIDTARANVVRNQLARAASGNSALQWLQLPRGRQNPDFVHSIADEGSPVKGGIVSQTATRQFKNWFAGSKVVDVNGKPLVVYRRDNDEFTVFDQAKTQQNDAGWLGKGFYFYGDKGEAERATGYGKNLRSFYLKAENPYYITPEEYNRLAEADDPKVSAEFTQRLKDEGYDSVYWNGDLRQEWMVLDSNQVKSATDNIGTFDPGNNDVRFHAGRGAGWIGDDNRRVAVRGAAGEGRCGRGRG